MKKRIILALFACVLCTMGQLVLADEFVAEVQVMPDEIVGVVLYPDGTTPVIDLPVRIWDTDRNRMVHRTKTNSEGVFRIPTMKEGRFYLFVGGLRIDMEVLLANKELLSQQHDLVIVLPRKMTLGTSVKVYDLLLIPLLIREPPPPPKVVSP